MSTVSTDGHSFDSALWALFEQFYFRSFCHQCCRVFAVFAEALYNFYLISVSLFIFQFLSLSLSIPSEIKYDFNELLCYRAAFFYFFLIFLCSVLPKYCLKFTAGNKQVRITFMGFVVYGIAHVVVVVFSIVGVTCPIGAPFLHTNTSILIPFWNDNQENYTDKEIKCEPHYETNLSREDQNRKAVCVYLLKCAFAILFTFYLFCVLYACLYPEYKYFCKYSTVFRLISWIS